MSVVGEVRNSRSTDSPFTRSGAACGLIGDDHRWVARECPGNCHTLALATREIRRKLIQLLTDANQADHMLKPAGSGDLPQRSIGSSMFFRTVRLGKRLND